MQTKRAEKERKGNLDCCLCGKCKAMSTNVESLCYRDKNKVSDEILNGNFLHFCLYMNFMHTEYWHSVFGIIGTLLKLKFSEVPR